MILDGSCPAVRLAFLQTIREAEAETSTDPQPGALSVQPRSASSATSIHVPSGTLDIQSLGRESLKLVPSIENTVCLLPCSPGARLKEPNWI